MRRREHQSGFGTIVIVLTVFAIAVLAMTGLVLYQHHKPNSAKSSAATSTTQTTTQPQSTTTTQTQQSTAQYLTIKEWGVKIPLSSKIQDSYYVVPTGITNSPDGRPSGIYLDVASLKNSCGDISVGNSNTSIEKAVGEIVRSLPTDKDPVSGKLYTQLNPNGTTIGGYYYGYSSDIRGKTCASQTLLQSVDSAFATATKGMVAATN